MAISAQQRGTLNLIARSPHDQEGWAKCAPKIWEQLILPMPDELVEKRPGSEPQVRLTETARAILKWT